MSSIPHTHTHRVAEQQWRSRTIYDSSINEANRYRFPPSVSSAIFPTSTLLVTLPPHRHRLDIYYLPPTSESEQEELKPQQDNGANHETVHGVTTISPAAAQSAIHASAHGNHSCDPLPPTSSKVPIIIHFNGGGWVRGSKDSEWRGAPPIGRSAARHGLVAVCANYRLAPLSACSIFLRALLLATLLWLIPPIHRLVMYILGTSYTFTALLLFLFSGFYGFYFIAPTRHRYVVHPQMMDDPARVIKWVVQHINEYVDYADPSQCFLSGHSAGAHLISLLATDHSYLQRHGIDINQHILGIFAVSGIFDLIQPMHKWVSNVFFHLVYGASLCGGYINTSVWHSASPLRFVSPQTIPMMLLSGARDLGLESGSQKMYEALRSCNVWCRWYTISNTSHSTIASLLEHHQAHKHLLEMVECLRRDRQHLADSDDKKSFAASEAEPNGSYADSESNGSHGDTALKQVERTIKTLA